jgi:putative transposase
MGPLSMDLRARVVCAVCEEGMSRCAAARRFGVSIASAVRWVAALRQRGDYAPLAMGGDQLATNARGGWRRMLITCSVSFAANPT